MHTLESENQGNHTVAPQGTHIQEMLVNGLTCSEYPQGNVLVFAWFRSRDYVASQPDKIYIFWDNTADRLVWAEATETQAVIRGLPNAFGIDTKHFKGKEDASYLTEADLDTFITYLDEAINNLLALQATGKTLVFPEAGIGTWAAKLAEKAPSLLVYINQKLLDTFGFDNMAHSTNPQYTSYYKKKKKK